jgi:antirestriction protein ArdC
MKGEQTRGLVDEAIDKLAASLERGESATLKAYLAMMGRFRRYSLGNQLLIAMARPNATHVAGFHTWMKMGRHVKAGERGIAIISPVVRKGQRSDEKDEPEARAVVAFKGAHVFDVSQTEGKPLPEFAQVNGDPAEHLNRLKAFVTAQGIGLTYAALSGAMGLSAGGRIILQNGMAPAEEFSTLAHECAHEMLHRADGAPADRTARETEAEAVAFVVCQAVGLECGTASSDYIQLYRGDRKLLMASLERIRGAAVEILAGVENTTRVKGTPIAATASVPIVAAPQRAAA